MRRSASSASWALPSALGVWTALFVAYLAASSRGFLSFAFSNTARFGPEGLVHFARQALLEPLLTLLIFFAAHRIGRRFLRAARLPSAIVETPVFPMALGLGVLSLGILACGLIVWDLWTTLAFFGLALLLLLVDRPSLSIPSAPKLEPLELFAGFFIFAAILAGWIQASAPPISWDALAYHLEIPKRWMQAGRICMLPSIYNAKNPLQPQALYLLAYGLGRDTLAQMIHLSYAALCAYSIYLFAREHLSRRAAAFSAAVFCCQPLFYEFAGTGNTDYTVCFFSFVAIWSFWLWSREGRRSVLLLSGALTGFACASKLIGLWLLIALSLCYAAFVVARRDWKRGASDGILWAAAVAAFGAPWYLLNWHWLGDPVWPYFSNWFGSGEASQALFQRLKASVTEGVSPSWVHLLLMPYYLIFQPTLFWYGPQYIVLPAFVLAILRLRSRPKIGIFRPLLIVCVLYTLIWFSLYQGWRYIIPAIPWACLFVGNELDGLFERGRWARVVAVGALLTLGGFVLAGNDRNNELFALSAVRSPAGSGLSWREYYLSRSLENYDISRFANSHLPANARIMLFGEMRPYYLDREHFYGDPLNDFRVGYGSLHTPDELDARLRALGVTHVLVNGYIGGYQGDPAYYSHAAQLMQNFLRERAASISKLNGVELFELKPPPRADVPGTKLHG